MSQPSTSSRLPRSVGAALAGLLAPTVVVLAPSGASAREQLSSSQVAHQPLHAAP